jgi:RNA-binding protein
MIGEIALRTDATLVQRIGHTAVFYRQARDKRQIVLPRA